MPKRWIYFLIVIFIGFVLAVYLGWYVFPTRTGNASPDTLRKDYKADIVLMVAEIYSEENDVTAAVERLALIGSKNPSEIVEQAVKVAEPYYAPADLELMRNLQQALLPGSGGGSP